MINVDYHRVVKIEYRRREFAGNGFHTLDLIITMKDEPAREHQITFYADERSQLDMLPAKEI